MGHLSFRAGDISYLHFHYWFIHMTNNYHSTYLIRFILTSDIFRESPNQMLSLTLDSYAIDTHIVVISIILLQQVIWP